ncbi:MAG: hypothetical protein QXG39_04820 [Candidatus Aenigmatarchaeota archaeon]
MTRKVVCPICKKVKTIRSNLQNYFYCCSNRWVVTNYIAYQTEKKGEENPKNKGFEDQKTEDFIDLEVVEDGENIKKRVGRVSGMD